MMRDAKYKHVALIAVSGTGKGTISKSLFSILPQLTFSVSAATRAPRDNEKNGKDYYFMSKEEFLKKRDSGEFAEWFCPYGDKFYGTLFSEIERIENEGKSILFDVNIDGALELKKSLGDKIVTIFIYARIETSEERLRLRGTEKEEDIQARIKTGKSELGRRDECDYVVDYDLGSNPDLVANTIANLILIPG